MLLAIGLGIIGLLLVYFEFFLPGGVMAVIGGILMLTSIVLFSFEYGGLLWICVYIIVMLGLLFSVIRIALWRIQSTKHKNTIFSNLDQEGYSASSFDAELIGRKGEAISTLKPSGHVMIDDHRYQALSRGTYIKQGEKIEVVGGKGAHLIVKKLRKGK